MSDTSSVPSIPPEASHRAHGFALWLLRPIDRFLRDQAASGLVLAIAAIVALVWANSPARGLYHALWETPITVSFGSFTSSRSLHFVVNDGLMTLFFFVVGLEIRTEIHEGELSTLRGAALPLAAAIGGMIAPAALFLALNPGPPESRGWGVPIATDIAFAVGVLALLGSRVAPRVRVLLLALAIIDDIGAVLVIALFYSPALAWLGLLVAGGGVVLVLAMQRLGVRRPLAYVPAGLLVWYGVHHAGIHPTMAGIVMGLLTPARPWFGVRGLVATAEDALERVREPDPTTETEELLAVTGDLHKASREAAAPSVRLEARLGRWVAFGVVPVFALANAGVTVSDLGLRSPGATRLFVSIVVALVVGKLSGVLGGSYIAVRSGVAELPDGVGWRSIVLVGSVAGIGFTMAIFIAGLAFDDPRQLGVAKLGVLAASIAAAAIGLLVGRVARPTDRRRASRRRGRAAAEAAAPRRRTDPARPGAGPRRRA